MKKLVWAVLLTASTVVYAAPAPQEIDKVVAVVNELVITQSQIDERLLDVKKMTPPDVRLPPDSELRKKILEDQIDLSLQLQVAKSAKIDVTDKQVEEAIANIAKTNQLTVAQLKEKLQEQGMSYDKYFKEIHDQYVIHKLQQQELVPMIQVTKQEVHDYLVKHPNPPQVMASRYHVMDYLISIPEQSPAAVVKQTEFFAQNVTSLLKGNKAIPSDMNVQVNDLGWRAPQELPLLFQPVVIKMNLNEVSSPVRADNGYHVLKLIEVEGAPAPVIQEVHLREILLKEDSLNDPTHIKQRFTQLRANLVSGGDFASIAKATSQDPQTSIDGGDMGWLRAGAYDPEVEAAVRVMKVGELSQPIKTSRGWVVVQLLGRRPVQDKQSLREVEARNAIFQKKFEEKLKVWMQQARSQAFIKIY